MSTAPRKPSAPAAPIPSPFGLLALTSQAKLPERRVPLCLRGDLVAELERLEAELSAAQRSPDTRLSGNAHERKLAQSIVDTQEEMRGSTVTFLIRGLNGADWTSLVLAHPSESPELNYNPETFFPALVAACTVHAITPGAGEPEPVADEMWQALIPKLSAGQWDELVAASIAVCQRKVDVPFSLAASVALRTSAETSD